MTTRWNRREDGSPASTSPTGQHNMNKRKYFMAGLPMDSTASLACGA
jgi:hypothetical protein